MKQIKNSYELLLGPFGSSSKYINLLPDFVSVNEKTDYDKNKKKLGSSWRYFNKEVSYELNSNFYRAPEWNTINWKESVVVFGCSHVFGEGLAQDETVCYQLENLLDRPVINFGQSGTSTIFSWHNSIKFFETFGIPYAVIQLWTDFGRMPYYTEDEIKRIGPWSGGRWDNYDSDMKSLYHLWNKNTVHSRTFFEFESKACNEFWKNKTNYYQGSFFKETAEISSCDYFEKLDDARDFIHSGFLTHKRAAEVICENSNIR
jgi:hypothetical protein